MLPFISYGSHEIDTAAIPSTSLEALLRRGITHYLGNEQAAKVSGKVKAFRDEFKTEPSDEQIAEWKASFQLAAMEKLLAGTLGVSAPRATSVDPVEREMDRLAAAEVRAILKANGLKVPKDDEAIEFANGTTRTMDEMIANRLAHAEHGPKIEAEARKNVAAREAKKASVKAEAKAGLADL